MKKVLTWGLVIFLIYYLATQPVNAADAVHSGFNLLKSAGNSLSTFVSSL
jgi:hypothetical protein